MKRITPEEVVEAYRKTGMTAAAECFRFVDNGVMCGCGAGAVAVADGIPEMGWVHEWLVDKGYKTDYLSGFYDGFDARKPKRMCVDSADKYSTGFEDGTAARLATKESDIPRTYLP